MIPSTDVADDIDSRVTIASYAFSSIASLFTWLILVELPNLLKSLESYGEVIDDTNETKQENYEIKILPQRKRSSNVSGMSRISINSDSKSNKGYTVNELNVKEKARLRRREARMHFAQSKQRILIQGVGQFFFPVIFGSVLGSQFRN